ncbi:MAG: sigma 54-interacting transcriptional regulator [Labilithrix sp.]|nr:sigma 54-interacting transcriptional regulator [Labilithrix sp.]MCW5813201.1 sigma 54-interacting transcriptional regulator [Labilithrix sp.]
MRPDAALLPSLRLEVVGASSDQSIPLGLEPVTIGSGPECDLILDDRRVSRRHCSMQVSEDGLVLRDLGSKNGTFVGDVRVREVLFAPDVFVSAGGVQLVVRATGSPTLVELSVNARFGDVVGGSTVMRALFAKLARAAALKETIFLRGESGTGKELLAAGIHANSPRKDGPFVIFDCGAVAPSLVESELFGSVRGAFTGATDRAGVLESARGGTLFLDEIGELPLDLQPRLLRVLESKQFRRVGANAYVPFDARVIAATHRDLRAGMRSGTFREDLFYRLAVVEVSVPPLRDRGEDLELLIELFLARLSPPRTIADLPPNAMRMLRSYDFPGNVRELNNVLLRLVTFPELGAEAFDTVGAAETSRPHPELFELPYLDARDRVLESFDCAYLRKRLQENGGRVAVAANASGVTRQFFYRLLHRYGMRRDDEE